MQYSNPIVFLTILVASVSQVSAGVRIVRTGTTYSTVQAAVTAARTNDIIEIDSNYSGSDCRASISNSSYNRDNLTIRGIGTPRPILDSNQGSLSNKGIFVVSAANVTIENLEFTRASSATTMSAAGVYLSGAGATIRSCYFHDNDNGIFSERVLTSNIVVESCQFAHNGYIVPSSQDGDGASHNINIDLVNSFTLQYCWSHNAVRGHEVRSSAKINYILYNRIMNEADNPSPQHNAGFEVQLPKGGTSYIIGNLIQQGANGDKPEIISYGDEGLQSGYDSHLYVVNNTIVNDRGTGTFISSAASAVVLLQNNIFQGGGTVLSGTSDPTSGNNLVTNNACLFNQTAFDYHLTAASVGAINLGGVPNPTPMPASSLIPAYQYVHPCNKEPRPSNGTIDIGAYECVLAPVNAAPTVEAGPDQTITLPNAAQLAGSATDDHLPDPPSILTCTWTKSSGPGTVAFANEHDPTTTATFSAPGQYQLRLEASDSALSSADAVNITVNPKPNTPPVVDAGADVVIYEGLPVNLHATASDADLDPLTYGWSQAAGQSATLGTINTADLSFTVPSISTNRTSALMTFLVTVGDGRGGVVSDTVHVQVHIAGDINRDWYVNVGDLQVLVAAWGGSSGSGTWNPNADLNADGLVNVGDLQVLVTNWGRNLP